MHTTFWLESLNGRVSSEDLGVDGGDNIKTELREIGLEVVY
jgi:hypothetical protein